MTIKPWSIETLDEAIKRLDSGEPIALPTDTVYGLAAKATDPKGIKAIYEIKKRPDGLELPVLVASFQQAEELIEESPDAEKLAYAFWPGALTIVVNTKADGPLAQGGYGQTVGLRQADEALVTQICESLGPLAVTSANLHGQPPADSAGAAAMLLGEQGLVIDGGPRNGMPSTVVDCSKADFEILRVGPISHVEIASVLSQQSR